MGRLVGNMIRRSVRKSFRNVYWQPPKADLQGPAIFVPNHHGWHDGYLMFHVVTALGLRSLDWIAEFDAFPPFAKIGGMPFPPNDPSRRIATVRRTIRLMRDEQRSLVLFAEQHLHAPPDLLPFGKALQTIADAVPHGTVVPVAIHYAMDIHERPEAFLALGEPVSSGEGVLDRTRTALAELLQSTAIAARTPGWKILARGTPDVNERWDMRRFRKKSR